jgi:hypothetical protein
MQIESVDVQRYPTHVLRLFSRSSLQPPPWIVRVPFIKVPSEFHGLCQINMSRRASTQRQIDDFSRRKEFQ